MPTTSAPGAPAAAERWAPDDAAAGVTDVELVALLRDYWGTTLEREPLWATQLGVHRFDDRVDDRSRDATLEERRVRRRFIEQAERLRARGGLSPGDATTLALLAEDLDDAVLSEPCELDLWTLDPRSNPITSWNELPEFHPQKTVEDGENLLARARAIAGSIDAEIANLRLGAKQGLYGNARSGRFVLEMVKKQLAQPVDDWPLLAPAKKPHDDWPAGVLAKFRTDLRDAVDKGVRPALERYGAAIETELLPHARGADAEGLGALPDGARCYAARIKAHTSLRKTAKELHQTGLDEIARIDTELATLGKKLWKTRDLPALLHRLRSDKKLYFASADAIVEKAESALAAAKAKTPGFFGLLPKADCVVRRVPDYEAPFQTIAYYRPPNPDGSKPGEYFVNVLAPETRPMFEAEVLAFHESIPGHHLQIAIAQELSALPAFRKHASMTAYAEGWGLYTERLAEEMGLYGSDLDRIGMLSFDAWRASRLVVDTGLHALGWTREQAEAFMLEHTALAKNNVQNEVDRYIVWPGQALAYKTGQLELLRLRAWAKSELGARFDLRGFHDAVLGRGAVSLPVLGEQVKAWVESKRGP